MAFISDLTRGIYRENPVLKQALGLCPTLAVSSSVSNGIGMGLAATFVLICSNVLISMIRKLVPDKIRIPVYIIVIATFVTIIDLTMAGFVPDLYKRLGIFVPLIVVNCIILGRAEAYASKNSVLKSLLDGISMGIGFTAALVVISSIREVIGNGTFLGVPLFGAEFEPVMFFALAPGAFVTIGFILAFVAWLDRRNAAK
ncbi:MAG TPA: electron transport complex subunit E [bacterium]|nr:electron transport complex subunit E [bacterium]HOZ22708.1 electron transport complex subunit E [bacterium]